MARFFTEREIRAVAVFLPLAGLLVAAVALFRPKSDPLEARRVEVAMERRMPADSIRLRPFDPNTADFDELLRLGLSKHEAVSLLKYRAAGKVFRIPEDLSLCYGISDSLYRRLAPGCGSAAATPLRPANTAAAGCFRSCLLPRRSASTRSVRAT